MKKIILSLIPLLLTLFAFIVLWGTFRIPHQSYYDNSTIHPYSVGNASQLVRDSIMQQLKYFEQGYLDRDTAILGKYCERLISKENILILGTMPREIYSGYEQAADLINSDWLYWGDVHYLMDQANISISGDVAWVSTIGYVEFDMSRFLVLPIRYSGILVREGSNWKFQQMQFQFDLDNLKVLFTLIILLLISLAFLTKTLIILIRYFRR